MPILNELVRDRTIEIIENEDGAFTYSILSEEEYPRELKRKLQEEVQKFSEANNTEDLTDIMELVFALAKTQGVSEDELMVSRNQKRQERGGFERRLFLQELSE